MATLRAVSSHPVSRKPTSAVYSAVSSKRAAHVSCRFLSILQRLESDPAADLNGFGSEPTDCLRLCKLRDECLRQAGFHDIYKDVKVRPTDATQL